MVRDAGIPHVAHLSISRMNFPEPPQSEVPRINLPKLFGKSDQVPNQDSGGRQEGVKELRSAASCRQRSKVEKPSAIFQTVSPRTPVNKARRAEAALRPGPLPVEL